MFPQDINSLLPDDIKSSTQSAVVDWLFSSDALRHRPVVSYLAFLKYMLETAYAIAEVYDLKSGLYRKGSKQHLRHIGAREMVMIANQLYVLKSYHVAGDILECGVSHGYSTCVLSHACARLGITLYAADSFQGLPAVRENQEFFEQGDYACSLNEVKNHLQDLGCPGNVTYIEGFYADSLKDFDRPLCVIWQDVDLFESANDVLENALSSLDRRGVIFTHEFTDFNNKVYKEDSLTPPGAVYQQYRRLNVEYRAIHLMRYFGAIGTDSSVGFDALNIINILLDRLHEIDSRFRQYYELRECRTTRFAFAFKKLLRPVLRGKTNSKTHKNY